MTIHSVSLSRTVEALHAAGVSHNDIAPRNVLVDVNGDVHLIDFSNSTMHECLGKDRCPELLELKTLVPKE